MGTGSRGGLEDIVVSTSDICFIDGREGRLVYRGYDVNDLVEHSSFEEVIFLLWHGGLPSKKELVAHTKAISSTANRKLPPGPRLAPEGAAEEDDPDGSPAHRDLGALGVRSGRRRQLQGRHRPQGAPADGPDADAGGRVGAHPPRQGAGGAEPEAQPRGELPLHDERQEAEPAGRQDVRRRADPPRRSRVQRVDVRGPRDGGDHVRPALVDRLGDRRAQGAAPRRRQRAGDADGPEDQVAGQRRRASSASCSPTTAVSWASAIACTASRTRGRST